MRGAAELHPLKLEIRADQSYQIDPGNDEVAAEHAGVTLVMAKSRP